MKKLMFLTALAVICAYTPTCFAQKKIGKIRTGGETFDILSAPDSMSVAVMKLILEVDSLCIQLIKERKNTRLVTLEDNVMRYATPTCYIELQLGEYDNAQREEWIQTESFYCRIKPPVHKNLECEATVARWETDSLITYHGALWATNDSSYFAAYKGASVDFFVKKMNSIKTTLRLELMTRLIE